MTQKPYIAYDLDALKLVPDIARGTNTPEPVIGYGLLRLWSYCWERKTDRVTGIHLTGFFAGHSTLGPALVAFGFLEELPGEYRVRGAERYLRLSEARSKGGKASAKNLIPGARYRKNSTLDDSTPAEVQPIAQPIASREAADSQPRGSREAADSQPREVSRLTIGSTPNTEHRTPNTLKTPKPPFEAEQPTSPPLIERVAQVFLSVRGAEYSVAWSDEKAGRALMAKGNTDEILRRWAIGLRARFPSCNSLSDLLKNWNAYATEQPAAPVPQHGKPTAHQRPGGIDGLTSAPTTGSPCEWAELNNCNGIGVADSGGKWLCAPCLKASNEYWDTQTARMSDAEIAQTRKELGERNALQATAK